MAKKKVIVVKPKPQRRRRLEVVAAARRKPSRKVARISRTLVDDFIHHGKYPMSPLADGAVSKVLPFSDFNDILLTTNVNGNGAIIINTGRINTFAHVTPVFTANNFPLTGYGPAIATQNAPAMLAQFAQYRMVKMTIDLIPTANAAANQGLIYVMRNPAYNNLGQEAFVPNINTISEHISMGNLRSSATLIVTPYSAPAGLSFLGVNPAAYADPPLLDGWPQLGFYVTGANPNTAVLMIRVTASYEVTPLAGSITERLMAPAPTPNPSHIAAYKATHLAVEKTGSFHTPTNNIENTISEITRVASGLVGTVTSVANAVATVGALFGGGQPTVPKGIQFNGMSTVGGDSGLTFTDAEIWPPTKGTKSGN